MAGTDCLFHLLLGTRLVVAYPAGGIFLDPVAFRSDLFQHRSGFLQLAAHQDAALLFLREAVFHPRELRGMFLLRLFHGIGQFILPARCGFICLAKIGAKLILAGTSHFRGAFHPSFHFLLIGFTIIVKQVQARRAVFVLNTPDHKLYTNSFFAGLLRLSEAENTAGNSFPGRRLIRIQDVGRHQALTCDTRDLKTVKRVLQDILHIYTVGYPEHRRQIPARVKNSGPGFAGFYVVFFSAAPVDFDIPVALIRQKLCLFLFISILFCGFFLCRYLRRIFDSAQGLRNLTKDLCSGIQTALQLLGRQMEAGGLLKDTVIERTAVCLIGRSSLHAEIKAVAVPAIKTQIGGNAAAVFTCLGNLLMEPVPILLCSHEKGIPCHGARKFLLSVAKAV